MQQVTRRSVIGGAVAAAGATIGRPASAQPKRTLVVVCQNDIANFDPHLASDDPTTLALRNVYDTLVGVRGRTPKPTPCLATSWAVSPDGLDYRFQLNPKARFHDGSPVTAADVAYSFERHLRLRQGSSWMIAGIVKPGAVQAVAADQVSIRLASPFAPFLSVLPWMRVVNAALVAANKGSDDGQTFLRTNTAGSGPFRLTRSEPGNLYEYQRVDGDWHEGGGNLTGVIVQIVRESSKQRLMLQTGDAHYAVNLTADDIDQLKGRPGIAASDESEFANFAWKLNTRHGPFTDPDLRKAVSYAFDYDAMRGVSGPAQLAQGPLFAGLPGFAPTLPVYRKDLGKAKEYLAKTPFANGGLRLVTNPITGHEQERRWSLVLLDSLKTIGIDLDIQPITWPNIVASTRQPESCADLTPLYTSSDYADPDDAAFAYHSSLNGTYQNPTYANPKVDEVIVAARQESDPGRRAELYGQFQRMVMDDAPSILGVIPVRTLAMRSSVKGFEFTPVRAATFEFLPLSLA